MFRFEKLTHKAQEALEGAASEARRRSNQQIDVEHLFLALLADPAGVPRVLLSRAKADAAGLQTALVSLADAKPVVKGDTAQEYLSRRLNAVLERSTQEADELKDDYVSTEHLLLSTLTDGDDKLSGALKRANVTRAALLAALKDI